MIKERKKIIHVSYYFHPLMGYDINLFAKFHSESFDFFIVTSNNVELWNVLPQELERLDKDFELTYNVKIIRLKSFKLKSKGSTVILPGLFRSIINLKPITIFVHGFEALCFYKLLVLLPKRIKLLADTHTLNSQLVVNSFTGKFQMFLFRNLIVPIINKDPNRFFYTALENREILINNFAIKENLVFDNDLAVNFKTFYPIVNPNFNLVDGLEKKLTIGYFGKFDSIKEPHLIKLAIKKLNLNEKINFLCVGAKDKKYMADFWGEPITNLREFHFDAIDNNELVNFYALCDFFVIPKFNSLSCLDMQACKKAVVMNDDSTNYYRCKYGGLLFQENNLEDLSLKIEELIQNSELRNKLAENGYNYVLENFNFDAKLKSIESNY